MFLADWLDEELGMVNHANVKQIVVNGLGVKSVRPELRLSTLESAFDTIRIAHCEYTKLIKGRVNRVSAIETVNSGSITGRVKPKTKNWY